MPTRISVFASGTGSNTRAILEFFQFNYDVEVSLIVTNRPDAGVIQVAEEWKVPYAIIGKSDLSDEELVLAVLEEYQVDVIILAGWLLLIPGYLVKEFKGRILNIHPALLPKFGGKGMWGSHVHKAVHEANERESGITIHLVNEHYDEGAIWAQHKVALESSDNPESIENKVRSLELKHYPQEIKNFIESL